MSVAIEFPGTPVVQTATASAGATATCTLPAPAAGILQYLSGYLITGAQSVNDEAATVTFAHLAVGGGSQPQHVFWSGPGGATVIEKSFPSGWPADALATSLSATCTTTAGMGLVTITLWGYNVPQ
jgi:hypothetical protein